MVDDKVLEFLQRVERESELRVRVQSLPVEDQRRALEELARIAQSVGYDLSAGALESGLRECAPDDALPESKLDGVVGGVSAGVSPTQPTYPTFQSSPTLAALQSKIKKSAGNPGS